EVDVVGPEAVLRRVEVDAMEDQVEIVAVRFDLRILEVAEGVFHRQLVEVKEPREDLPPLFGRRVGQVDPDEHAGGGSEPRRIDPIGGTRPPVGVRVDPDQSPTFTWSAACAAARRATGMRYGDALT